MMRQFINDAATGAPVGGGKINATYAVAMAATLGQKGADYYTCGPSPFTGAEHVLSVVYNPAAHRIFVAWEDGAAAGSGSSTRFPSHSESDYYRADCLRRCV